MEVPAGPPGMAWIAGSNTARPSPPPWASGGRGPGTVARFPGKAPGGHHQLLVTSWWGWAERPSALARRTSGSRGSGARTSRPGRCRRALGRWMRMRFIGQLLGPSPSVGPGFTRSPGRRWDWLCQDGTSRGCCGRHPKVYLGGGVFRSDRQHEGAAGTGRRGLTAWSSPSGGGGPLPEGRRHLRPHADRSPSTPVPPMCDHAQNGSRNERRRPARAMSGWWPNVAAAATDQPATTMSRPSDEPGGSLEALSV